MNEALGMLRTRKESRMRAFGTRQAAVQYSSLGYSTLAIGPVPKLQQQQYEPSPSIADVVADLKNGSCSPRASQTNSNGTATATTKNAPNGIDKSTVVSTLNSVPVVTKAAISQANSSTNGNGAIAVKSNTTSTSGVVAIVSASGDKPSFRGPKSQELVQFRKLIEQSKYDQVRDTAWKNPRFLIGSGDTPALLKESTRYNALHVAALAQNATMCELLLDIVGDPKFIQLLYGAKNAHHCAETGSILQDLYLNMPERGRHETPLHLAAKFGAVDVVNVLTSYAQCTSVRNSDGHLPIDVSFRRFCCCFVADFITILHYLFTDCLLARE